ncbi:MAG TPA: hypothetical protein VK859_01345, partial [bacterium]|nr:hypothetical protein [bacterium]
KQLHSRDLILAETMMQAAVAAYKKGQFEFTALMLAHQTYAAAKTEEIQIRAEIVNARLAGLVGDEEPEAGGKTDYSSNLPNTDTYLWETPKGVEKNMPSTPAGETPTPVPGPRHLLGANNPMENSNSAPMGETVTPTPAVESPNPPEAVEPGATPVVDQDQPDSDKTTPTNPPPLPTAGADDGDSSKEPK